MLSEGLPHGRLRAFDVVSVSLLPSPVECAWSTEIAFRRRIATSALQTQRQGSDSDRQIATRPWPEAWHRGREPESPIDTDNPSGRRSRNHDGRQFRFDF